MMDKSNKDLILKIIGLAVAVFLLAYIVGGIIKPPPESLESIIKDIDVKTVPHPMGIVEIQTPDLSKALPDISKYPPQVNSITLQLHRNIFLNGKSWQRY